MHTITLNDQQLAVLMYAIDTYQEMLVDTRSHGEGTEEMDAEIEDCNKILAKIYEATTKRSA